MKTTDNIVFRLVRALWPVRLSCRSPSDGCRELPLVSIFHKLNLSAFQFTLGLGAMVLAGLWACSSAGDGRKETEAIAPQSDATPALSVEEREAQATENSISVDRPLEHRADSGNLFVEVAGRAGIQFLHYNGSTGEYLLPEITGSGGALFDYDNDGDLDLYVVQGSTLLASQKAPQLPGNGPGPPRDRLYRNDGAPGGSSGLKFTDVTTASGVRATGYGMGAAVGDYNNDGFLDLYVTNVGPNQLWCNNGDGTFREVIQAAGADDARWSASATFFDYDRDGWLDLFVATTSIFPRRCSAAALPRAAPVTIAVPMRTTRSGTSFFTTVRR